MVDQLEPLMSIYRKSSGRIFDCKSGGKCLLVILVVIGLIGGVSQARAAGGPLGIDHQWTYDNSGIWKRSNQQALEYGLIAGVVAGALWEGGESRLGRTFWTSLDSELVGGLAAAALKYAFSRERPSDTRDPNQWFSGHGRSFPSGEVTLASAAVTPFVLEYGRDHPAVYALELIPLYDAVARLKSQAHWQTDVLAAFALGSATAYFMHERETPLVLGYMPQGIYVGFKTRF
jgi:undecaprenyl-diphosphatase